MKIAYLVLAHNQPQQLLKLYAALTDDISDFYIHVDHKSKDKEAIAAAFAGKANVKVISVHEVYWMGFNMVQATIDLLKLAYNSGTDYKYFNLMSGQDYPIKSKQYINDFLAGHHEDFIDCIKIKHLPAKFARKYQLRHFYDTPYTNPRDPRRIPFLVKMYYRLKKVEAKLLPPRKFFNGMEPFFGPQWFMLTKETVGYILRFIEERKDYTAYMRTTEGTDETYIQTIVGNSPRFSNMWGYDKYMAYERNFTPGTPEFTNYAACSVFMDWSERAKTKPAVLTMEYFDEIKTAGHLFARKFDVNQSQELIKKIDSDILHIV
jgi:hypothetical protein